MAKEEKVVKDVTREDEQMQMSVTKNYADPVVVRGRIFMVKWMHPATADWITALMLKDSDDNKVIAQCAALIRLNGFWKAHLFYWFVWRWYYYVRQYNSEELAPLFEMAQKKTQSQAAPAYLNAMGLLIALKTTKKQMTKKEVEHILQELRTANDGK
jgi:hypothetical protein